METHGSREAKDTSRTEAFSDGVFAFAITLLVLNLRDPSTSGVSLSQGLIDEWQSFFALGTTFITVLVMWLNHHNMFSHIGRVDRRLMLRNGMLLLFVVLTPFTTSLVAGHMTAADASDSRTAAAVYSGNFFLIAVAWNTLWRYCAKGRRLLREDVTDAEARTITRQYAVAPIGSVVAIAISLISGLASVTVVLVIAAFYAITGSHGE
jgi:TMEM175 potassium channel family protein